MKTLLMYLLLVTFLFVYCSPIPTGYSAVNGKISEINHLKCVSLHKKVQKKWLIHNDCTCFYHNKNLIKDIIFNQDCLTGVDTSTIIQLFGKPTTRGQNVLTYRLSKNCKKGDEYGTEHTLDFYIDFNKTPNLISKVMFTYHPLLE